MAGNEVVHPVLMPLPQTCDKDLTDAATIAEAHGYTRAAKTAGSRHKVKATRGKGKLRRGFGSSWGRHRWSREGLRDSMRSMRASSTPATSVAATIFNSSSSSRRSISSSSFTRACCSSSSSIVVLSDKFRIIVILSTCLTV